MHADAHHTLAFVTVTELLDSSGIVILSMPARLEWSHFKFVSRGQISCMLLQMCLCSRTLA